MALLAIIAKVVIVHIIVASVAIGKRHIRKVLKVFSATGLHLVAFLAIHIFVLANERVIRFVVVKFFGGGKSLGCVAFCTIIIQRLLVVILMTVDTSSANAEVSFNPLF
jgi:hypothetical protein